jgi:hypothetical protein
LIKELGLTDIPGRLIPLCTVVCDFGSGVVWLVFVLGTFGSRTVDDTVDRNGVMLVEGDWDVDGCGPSDCPLVDVLDSLDNSESKFVPKTAISFSIRLTSRSFSSISSRLSRDNLCFTAVNSTFM